MALEVLDTLRSLGVTVTAVPPDRLRLEPASKIPVELVPRILESKPEILAALARPSVEPAECRHCAGKGECSYPCCTLRRTSEPTPCSMCRWEDHRLWVAATRPSECWFCEERRLHGEVGLCWKCEGKAMIVQ
jgi:hypothetical protein